MPQHVASRDRLLRRVLGDRESDDVAGGGYISQEPDNLVRHHPAAWDTGPGVRRRVRPVEQDGAELPGVENIDIEMDREMGDALVRGPLQHWYSAVFLL